MNLKKEIKHFNKSVIKITEMRSRQEYEAEKKEWNSKIDKFFSELEKLSKKYGVVLNDYAGRISFGDVSTVNYDYEFDSGDWNSSVRWSKEVRPY